jgi:putative Holliday junction resolvase
VLAIAAEQEADVIVVGLPVSLDGKEHGQAARIRKFGKVLETRSLITVVYHDERFSTLTAANLRREANVKRKLRSRHLDDIAAAVILQDYLEQQRAFTAADGEV